MSTRSASTATNALTGNGDATIRLWDLSAGDCLRILHGHWEPILGLVWSGDGTRALSGSGDRSLRLWDVKSGVCLRSFTGHEGSVNAVAWSADQRRAVSAGQDRTIRLWDLETGHCITELEGHMAAIWCLACSTDCRRVLSGSSDRTLRLWDTETGKCLRTLEGHTDEILSVAWNAKQDRTLSGSRDKTLRLWDLEKGECVRIISGHNGPVRDMAWSADEHLIFSSDLSRHDALRLWNLDTEKCIGIFEDHASDVCAVGWSAHSHLGLSGDEKGVVRFWDLSWFVTDRRLAEARAPSPSLTDHVHYTNAKVLLVGDSGAGKTGLANVLVGQPWQPTDSTVGAWATQWNLPITSDHGIEREIWLWDFGGQADQRLIHQLYMDETALAALIFDGQKSDVFETIGEWDRDLTRASGNGFAKLLVAGRVDAGGLRLSRNEFETFASEHAFDCFLETSAKTGIGCEQLKEAISDNIKWENIPWRSSPLLFKRLKDEIIRLRDEGRVLMRFNELRETLRIRLPAELASFSIEQLKAVLALLAGPGAVWELKFGAWVLLQPERINAYAQAVIRTMRDDQQERGCISEERVLRGDLIYYSSMRRLEADEERFILLAMDQILVERRICLRAQTDNGPLLVFPSYYRRERAEQVGHPAVLVSYRFTGFLDEIYSTLVVRLHHTTAFEPSGLWRYAADFKTLTGKQLGVKLTRQAHKVGELEVYFDPTIPIEEKIIFSKYVHEHLLDTAKNVVRFRRYLCPYCGTPVLHFDVATERLEAKKKDILCVKCDDPKKRVPLWDELEQLFGSDRIRSQVTVLKQESDSTLDGESKERVLVGEVISTVALAGQIAREFNVSDHGIDMEIEFKSDAGEATGRKIYLQLKSGDSYLTKREGGRVEIFRIRKARHADYWRKQAFPVVLLIRGSDGVIRWMDVREYLVRESESGNKTVNQIIFDGQSFDVMSVRRWREWALSQI
jgi:small GTP-binding protein